ncbi:hypothetical protein V2J09_021478 [Rumex salicifolius]
MDKGKAKLNYSSVLCTEASQANTMNSNIKSNTSNSKNQNLNKNSPKGEPKDLLVLEKRQKNRRISPWWLVLLGILWIILRFFAKLRVNLKCGWFEIIFSNPLDLKKVWEERRFHISAQLLLLKKWRKPPNA